FARFRAKRSKTLLADARAASRASSSFAKRRMHFGSARINALDDGSSSREGTDMPRGDKGSYTNKQKRQAEHIEEGYKKRGVSSKTAAKRAWATVNKESGGGKKSKSKKAA